MERHWDSDREMSYELLYRDPSGMEWRQYFKRNGSPHMGPELTIPGHVLAHIPEEDRMAFVMKWARDFAREMGRPDLEIRQVTYEELASDPAD